MHSHGNKNATMHMIMHSVTTWTRGKIYPGMSKQDYEAYDWTDEKNSADGQIGNSAMTSLTRNKRSFSGVCICMDVNTTYEILVTQMG